MVSTSSHAPPFDAMLVIAIVVLITVAPLLPAAAVGVLTGLAILTMVAWKNRFLAATPLGVFSVVCLALGIVGVAFSQIVLGVGLIAYAVLVRTVPWLRGAAAWIRRGSFGTDIRLLTAASGVIAAGALLAWYLLLDPDIDDLVQTFVPDAPLGLLIVGGLAFSMVNAAVEEGAYRGVVLHGLDTALGPGLTALVLQAAAFGALHVQGFPRGWLGVTLASIYGLMMGVIRRRAGGMFAPWVAHVFTDIVIAGIVVLLGRPGTALLTAGGAEWLITGR